MSTQAEGELMRSHAWKYFELHSAQRMQAFNFFLGISGVIITGSSAALVTMQQEHPSAVIFALPMLLLNLIICYIFSKLDQRTAFLIKHAEEIIKELEIADKSPMAKLFLEEEHKTKQLPTLKEMVNFYEANLTYVECFRLTFGVVALLTVAEAMIALVIFSWSTVKSVL